MPLLSIEIKAASSTSSSADNISLSDFENDALSSYMYKSCTVLHNEKLPKVL